MPQSFSLRYHLIAVASLLGVVTCPTLAAPIQVGPISSQDTLWRIARQYYPAQARIGFEQFIDQIVRDNPDAFVDGQAHQLRLGVTLRMPEGARDTPRVLPVTPTATPQPLVAVAPEKVVEPPAPAVPVLIAQSDASPKASAQPGQDTPTELALAPEIPSAQVPFRETALYVEARQAIAAKAVAPVVPKMETAEVQYAGDPAFDYLYGVVLLDNGSAGRALFPLLRASQQQPTSLGVRLDLGRAYFETGENESARAVFSGLAAQNPPARAAQVINDYLRAIDRRAARYESRLAGSISLQSGYDSNANSATDALIFQGFTLDERSRSTDSPYAGLAGQVDYSRPLSPRFRWLINARGHNREFTDAEELSTLLYGVGTGLGYRRGNWQTSLVFNASQLLVDGEDNSDSVSANLGWAHSGSAFWTYRLQAQYGQVRYDQVSVRDVDQVLLALGASRRLNLGLGAELGANLLGGVDEAVEAGSPNGRDLIGLSVNGVLQFAPRWQGTLSSHWLDAQYDGQFAGMDRSDQQWSSELALNFNDNRWRQWVLRAGVLYVDNRSDVELFDYDRLDVSIRLRRLFD